MSRFNAHGTTVEFASADIGRIINITPPDRSKGDVEITVGESGGDREYIPGLREGGTLTLEMLLDVDNAGQDALYTNYDADGVTETCFIVLPSTATAGSEVATYRFVCYVNAEPTELPVVADDPATLSVTLKVTGAVSLTVI